MRMHFLRTSSVTLYLILIAPWVWASDRISFVAADKNASDALGSTETALIMGLTCLAFFAIAALLITCVKLDKRHQEGEAEIEALIDRKAGR